MALIETETVPGAFPRCEISLLPYAFPNAEVGARVYGQLLEKYCFDTELKDVKVLITPTMAGFNYNGNKELHKLEDFKGLKLATAGKVSVWTIEALGGTPLELSTADWYGAFERGLAHGCFLPASGVFAFGLQQVTKYRTNCELFIRSWVIAMNPETWESLPEDVKKVFNENSGPDVSAYYSGHHQEVGAGATQGLNGYDKKVGNPGMYTLSADEKARWGDAVKPVWDQWVEEREADGIPASEMLDDALKLIQEASN